MSRKIYWWSVVALLLSLACLGTIGWVGSELALHAGYERYEWSLSTFPDVHPEHIHILRAGNVLLDGRFFPGARPTLVILTSGYGDTEDQMLLIAGFLHQAGLSERNGVRAKLKCPTRAT